MEGAKLAEVGKILEHCQLEMKGATKLHLQSKNPFEIYYLDKTLSTMFLKV
jgi:hypothetical protein